MGKKRKSQPNFLPGKSMVVAIISKNKQKKNWAGCPESGTLESLIICVM